MIVFSRRRGVTLVELLMTLALVGVLTATLLPVFSSLRRSWRMAIGDTEITQTARVFMDHIDRHLAQAQRLVAVSAPEATSGFLTFIDHDGRLRRYAVQPDGSISYGAPESPARLAGPVDSLRFYCYIGDPATQQTTMQLDTVRLVQVAGVFKHPSEQGRARLWRTYVYVRAQPPTLSDRSLVTGHVPGLAFAEVDNH